MVVLQILRLAAPEELQETCHRVREYFGDCRVVIVASAATAAFVNRLGCAERVVTMTRWSRPRIRALARRVRRRGATDTCIVFDAAPRPGPARFELLALAMRTPLCYRELGGKVRPLSRSRLWSRCIADIALAGLAGVAGTLAAMVVALGLLIVQPLLARPQRQFDRRRRRIRQWNDEWLRRL